MKKEYSYLLLLFINLFMPISPYFCLVFNFLFYAILSKNKNNYLGGKLNGTITLSLLIFLLTLFAFACSSIGEFEVIGKYLRCLLTTYVLVKLGGCFILSETKLMTLTLCILFIHIAVIPVQMLFPSIVPPMAEFFNCDRDPALFQRLSIRNMGTAGSFDMASYFSIIGFVLSFATFNKTRNNKYLILAFLFFISLIRISRTGMFTGSLFFFFCLFKNYKYTSGKSKVVFLAIFAGLIAALMIRIIPLISSTSNLLDGTGLYHYEDIEQLNDYGPNSSVGLTTYHLDILKHIDFFTTLIGGAFNPNSTSYGSDIGYVKMICNNGIIGLILIFILHYIIYKRSKKYAGSQYTGFVHFLTVSIIVVMVLNYKNLLMYSRGAYDGLVFMSAVTINSASYLRNNYERP